MDKDIRDSDANVMGSLCQRCPGGRLQMEGNADMSSVGVRFCKPKVLSRGLMAVTLWHWIQSETDNTSEHEADAVCNMEHRTAF